MIISFVSLLAITLLFKWFLEFTLLAYQHKFKCYYTSLCIPTECIVYSIFCNKISILLNLPDPKLYSFYHDPENLSQVSIKHISNI